MSERREKYIHEFKAPQLFSVEHERREHLLTSPELGKVAVISGFVGVGKDTIANSLLSSDGDIARIVTFTTREPRLLNGEVDGVSYHFVDPSNFQLLSYSDVLVEQTHIFGNFYGVPISEFKKREDSIGVVACLTPDGANTLNRIGVPNERFVVVPGSWEELVARIIKRDRVSSDTMLQRLSIEMQEHFRDLMASITKLVDSDEIYLKEGGIHYVKSATGMEGIQKATQLIKYIAFSS